MPTDPRWTEDTERLVRAATAGCHVLMYVGAWTCRCGAGGDDDDPRGGPYVHLIRLELAALADAGLLVEPGSTRYEFAHEHVLSDGPGPCLPIHDHTCPDSRYRRTVHTGPWRPVGEVQP